MPKSHENHITLFLRVKKKKNQNEKENKFLNYN